MGPRPSRRRDLHRTSNSESKMGRALLTLHLRHRHAHAGTLSGTPCAGVPRSSSCVRNCLFRGGQPSSDAKRWFLHRFHCGDVFVFPPLVSPPPGRDAQSGQPFSYQTPPGPSRRVFRPVLTPVHPRLSAGLKSGPLVECAGRAERRRRLRFGAGGRPWRSASGVALRLPPLQTSTDNPRMHRLHAMAQAMPRFRLTARAGQGSTCAVTFFRA
jgi:hypothetical protein